MNELEKIKIQLNISDTGKDDLLTLLLEDAESQILEYCNRYEATDKMAPLIRELAVINYNKQGTEGISSSSEGALSVSFIAEMPEYLKARLNNYRLAKIARRN